MGLIRDCENFADGSFEALLSTANTVSSSAERGIMCDEILSPD